MKRYKIVLILLLTVLVVLFITTKNIPQSKLNLAPEAVSQNVLFPTPLPSPTPFFIDREAVLENEVEKLTPEDFGQDFQNLKEEASRF